MLMDNNPCFMSIDPITNFSGEPVPNITNYSEVLVRHEVRFNKMGNYLESGEVKWVQGWILDISVVVSQVVPLLDRILPLLTLENTPFRLVRNREIAGSIMRTGCDPNDVAKITSLYPHNDLHALELALKLIDLTSSFRGPEIPTDRQLSGVVYTRFGAGRPVIRVNNRNVEEKFIYDSTGNLIKEPVTVPFHLPTGINWPFYEIIPPQLPKKETVLQDRYKPMAVLKEDVKGSVKKALWLEKLYKIRWCVIKEGRKCMVSDDWGRDVHDRMSWEFQLQKDLQPYIPVPRVYDFFKENGNSYLVMQLIKGVPLIEAVTKLFSGRLWPELSLKARILLLDYAKQILDIIGIMHEKGYIHRDIMPNNFLIDRRQRLWLIDLELSYSRQSQRPSPPYLLGTPGFMSPEQEMRQDPTEAQDIYSIGAIFVLILTGLLPNGFATENSLILQEQLRFFITDNDFIQTLTDCFSIDPGMRPSLQVLRASLAHLGEIQKNTRLISYSATAATKIESDQLARTIRYAINGLSTPILLNSDGLWFSIMDETVLQASLKPVHVYKGYYRGVSGVIYLLSKARSLGFSVAYCENSLRSSIKFIQQSTTSSIQTSPGGLYLGTAGMALALLEALDAGLIPKSPTLESNIELYLENPLVEGYGIGKGLAGKGLALLRASEIMEAPSFKIILQTILNELLTQQQSDGSWISGLVNHKKTSKSIGAPHDVAGIIIYLLAYIDRTKDAEVEQATIRSLRWLTRRLQNNRNNRMQNRDTTIILSLIKGYKVLGDPQYKELAEERLAMYENDQPIADLTIASGLSGIGELYVEAANAFASERWKSAANRVANFLLHYFVLQNDKSCYWLTNDTSIPTADLLTGNSGVIHFLLRNYDLGHLRHPILIV